MEQEVQLLVDRMTVSKVEEHLTRTFYRGTVAGHEAVVVYSGIGKVRASACCQFLIDRFSVDRVIFTGAAGALTPRLSVGDIVVSEKTTEWDFQSSVEGHIWHQADPGLVSLAKEAAARLHRQCFVGSILTGDRPVLKTDHKHKLLAAFNADCVEMEGGAVGLVCRLNNVPFVLIRVISDFADESALQEFDRSFSKVAPLPTEVVLEMLKEM